MSLPEDLKYTKDHEWVKIDGDSATVGITDHAQDQLGDVVFVELPGVGDVIKAEATFGTVESVKAVSDLYAPLSGEIVAVNEALDDQPELVNSAPYDSAWMIKIKLSDVSEVGGLLDAAAYADLIK